MVICLEQGADLHMDQLMPLPLASVKSRLVLPVWYRPTRLVLDKGPLNGCVCVCVLNEAADKPIMSQFWRIRVGQVFFVQIIFPRWRQSGPSSSTELMWLTISHEVM